MFSHLVFYHNKGNILKTHQIYSLIENAEWDRGPLFIGSPENLIRVAGLLLLKYIYYSLISAE